VNFKYQFTLNAFKYQLTLIIKTFNVVYLKTLRKTFMFEEKLLFFKL